MEMKWTHICGRTWCVEGRVCIPVYLLNDREAVLLDSGYVEDRPQLDALLREKRLKVRAVLGSHSHNDHSGCHAGYQEEGAEIILPRVEAAIASDFSLLAAAYWPASPRELKRDLSHLLVQADRTFAETDTSVEVCGQCFGLLPLPGHTPGHTGIVTPDGVLYVGDAVLSSDVLRAARLPSTADWEQDLASKRRLEGVRYDAYVLAHNGIYTDLHPLLRENIADKLRRAQQLLDWLREKPCWTQAEVVGLLWERLGLRSRSFFNQVIFQRNAVCAIEYLAATGAVISWMENGIRCCRTV